MNEERYKKLLRSAKRYTAYRERAPQEVADKLAEWDAPQEIIEQILVELRDEKFIDEQRFARAFCHDKFRFNKWGKKKIILEIRKYKISKEALAQGLAYINADEYFQTLSKLAEAKWSKLKEPDLFKKKQKTVAYLLQKGFESDLIWEATNALEDK